MEKNVKSATMCRDSVFLPTKGQFFPIRDSMFLKVLISSKSQQINSLISQQEVQSITKQTPPYSGQQNVKQPYFYIKRE